MSEPFCRAPLENETGTIAAIWHEGWHEAHGDLVPPELTEGYSNDAVQRRTERDLAYMRVVDVDGQIAGFHLALGNRLQQLHVARRFRGRGYSKLLLDDAAAQFAERGIAKPWIACPIGNLEVARALTASGWALNRTALADYEIPGGLVTVRIWRFERE